MGRITIVLAGDRRFRPYVEEAKRHAENHGYSVHIYDLGGLGFGTPFKTDPDDLKKNQFIPCTFKPKIISDSLARVSDLLVYMDADTVICRPLNINGNFDVGVVCRPEREVDLEDPKVGLFNSGVLFFYPTRAARRFLKTWNQDTDALNSDQEALNAHCPEKGIKIRLFPAEEYNRYPPPTPKTKILHFKGAYRKQWPCLTH